MEAVPSVCFIWPERPSRLQSTPPTFTASGPSQMGIQARRMAVDVRAAVGTHDANNVCGIALCIGYGWYCGNWFRIWPSAAHHHHETTHDRQKVYGPWGAG